MRKLSILVLAFLLVAILSTVFSVDRSSSLFGFYGRFSNGLIGLLSLGALYFLITNNIRIRSQVSTPGLETEGEVDDELEEGADGEAETTEDGEAVEAEAEDETANGDQDEDRDKGKSSDKPAKRKPREER